MLNNNLRPKTVAGLIEKHREIAGQIEAKRRELNAPVFDLEAIEHTICVFDPSAQPSRAESLPSQEAAFKGYQMRREVLNALRTAQGPITSLEIARQVIARRKLSDDPKTVSMIRKRVGAALFKIKAGGWLAKFRRPASTRVGRGSRAAPQAIVGI